MPGPREQPRWHRDTRRCWGSGVQVGPPPQCGAPTGRREGPADVNPPAARAPRGSARAGRWQYLQLLVLLAVDLQGLPDVLGDLQLLVLEGGPELAGQDDGVDPKRRLLVRGPLLVLLADVGVDAAGVRHILEASRAQAKAGAGRAGRGVRGGAAGPTFSMTSQKCIGASPKRSFSSSTLRISLWGGVSGRPRGRAPAAPVQGRPLAGRRQEAQFQPSGSWASSVPAEAQRPVTCFPPPFLGLPRQQGAQGSSCLA